MTTLFLDIETLPADESSYEALKYLYERKLYKAEKRNKKSSIIGSAIDFVEGVSEKVLEGNTGESADNDKRARDFEEYIRGTSFDGGFGRILCIAYAIDDNPALVLCNPDDERKTLQDFWNLVQDNRVGLYVGHNVMDFDLRFIYQRSVVLGVVPTVDLPFARYRNTPIFDTMKEWSKWGQNNIGLEHIALALGIPTPKEGIDGSQVFDFYKAGKVKEICDYCMRDVDTTRAVYKRMVFMNE